MLGDARPLAGRFRANDVDSRSGVAVERRCSCSRSLLDQRAVLADEEVAIRPTFGVARREVQALTSAGLTATRRGVDIID